MSGQDRPGRPLFALTTMGARVEVRAFGEIPEEFLDGLRASWADCSLEPLPADGVSADPDGLWALLIPSGERDAATRPDGPQPDFTVDVGEPETWPLASQQFTTSLTMALIRHHSGRRHLFHAASLADPETGRTVVLVGPSGRGKTTASIALARDGWTYLTDETTVVEHGSPALTPFAKPLSVIEVPGEPKVQSAASSLGMRLRAEGDPEPRLSRLVVLERLGAEDEDPDVDRLGAVIEPMDRFDGLQILMEQSSGLAKTRDGLRGVAELADSVGGIHRVSYREAVRLAEPLRAWLRTGTAPAREHPEDVPQPDWTFHPARRRDAALSRPSRRLAADQDPAAIRWVRDLWSQGIESGGEALVLRQDRSFILNPLTSRVWLLLEEPLDADELAERLEPDFGPAPEGAVPEILEAMLLDELVAPAEDLDALEPETVPEFAEPESAGASSTHPAGDAAARTGS